MGDGTERLRGQLREAAQRGQADDYGGDRIEDTAARVVYQTRRGVESLLKKKKSARRRGRDGETRTDVDLPTQEAPADPPLQEAPAERPSPYEPPPREQPRIKTREAVSTREGPPPAEWMRETRIKTRETAVHNSHPDAPPAPQAGAEPPRVRARESAVRDSSPNTGSAKRVRTEPPKIKTRDAAAGVSHGQEAVVPADRKRGPSDWMDGKAGDACTQRHPSSQEQPPSIQGRRESIWERGRTPAMKRVEVQGTGRGHAVQAKGGMDAALPAPGRRGHAGGQGGHAPSQAVRRLAGPGNPNTRSVREGGRTTIKTARSGKKRVERTARKAVKTAERSSQKTVKATQRTVKTAQRTVKTAQKTAQAAVQATQRAVQAARAAAKTTAATVKATAKATVAAVKAAIAAVQALAAAIAAGGWVVLVIVLVICIAGLLIASPFGIFFADDSNAVDAVSPPTAVAQINGELAERLSDLQTVETYDNVEIQGQPPAWAEVLAVFAAKTAGAEDGMDVAILDLDRVERLRTVFWDMTKITTEVKTADIPASGDAPARTETELTITITPRTPDDMRVFYQFTDDQNEALDELLANSAMLTALAGDLSITSRAAKDLLAALPNELSPERRAVVENACRLVGKLNYFWGGKSTVIGWDSRWGQLRQVTAEGSSTTGTYRPFGLDCSGFVDWVLRNAGLPSDGHWYINKNLTEVSQADALPGDLALSPDASHLGIVVGWNEGGELMVCHCSSGQNNVVITEFAASGFTVVGRPAFMGG